MGASTATEGPGGLAAREDLLAATLGVQIDFSGMLLSDPRVIAAEAAALSLVGRDRQHNERPSSPTEAMLKARDTLPRNATEFERGMAAGMAFLRAAQLAAG